MVDHKERQQLAFDLCNKMISTYPDQVIVGGLYGSTARGNDTPWSDLEMMFVVADDCPARGQHFLFRGIAAGYRVYRQSDLEQILTKPSLEWPGLMGVLSVLKVIHGDPEQVQRWLDMGRAVPREKFKEMLEAELPGLVVESHGRIHSCIQRGDYGPLFPSVLEVLHEANTALCLLNQRWVTHDYYQGLVDAFAFPKLPEGHAEMVPALYNARDPEEIVALADTFVERFWRLIETEGIRVRDYASIEEVPLTSRT